MLAIVCRLIQEQTDGRNGYHAALDALLLEDGAGCHQCGDFRAVAHQGDVGLFGANNNVAALLRTQGFCITVTAGRRQVGDILT